MNIHNLNYVFSVLTMYCPMSMASHRSSFFLERCMVSRICLGILKVLTISIDSFLLSLYMPVDILKWCRTALGDTSLDASQ